MAGSKDGVFMGFGASGAGGGGMFMGLGAIPNPGGGPLSGLGASGCGWLGGYMGGGGPLVLFCVNMLMLGMGRLGAPVF
jgi:hypothetical protein